MDQIKVSVIVPIYNVEAYLERCILSLARQSLREIEILAVNDGSPDSSEEILTRLEQTLPQGMLRVLNKENGGLSDARNYGLARARGKYIAFVDGDDYVDLDLFQRLYEKAEETGADAVACDIRYVWENGEEKLVSSGFPSFAQGTELSSLFTRFYPAVWNKIYRREILEESGVVFKKGAWFEDVEFSHRLFPYLKSVAAVEVACINYVQRQGSVTAKADWRLFDYLTNFESIVSFFRDRNLLSQWKTELEYASCRYLLATFLKRAASFEDADFERALSGSLQFLKLHFPHWKKNPYLLKNGAKGLYLLLFTPTLARLMRRVEKR